MEGFLGVCDRFSGGAIVCSSVSFAKVVGLNTVGYSATELPVYLIQIIGQQYHTADDPSPGCGFDYVFDTAEK